MQTIAQRLHIAEKVARRWVTRFNAAGMTGLEDKPRSGRPATYSREEVGDRGRNGAHRPEGTGASPSAPGHLSGWNATQRGTRSSHQAQPHPRSLACRRLALARAGDLVRGAGRSRLRAKKGRIETLYTAPPAEQFVICLDEWGQSRPSRFAGQRSHRRERATRSTRQAGNRLWATRERLCLRRLPSRQRGCLHPRLSWTHDRQLGGLP